MIDCCRFEKKQKTKNDSSVLCFNGIQCKQSCKRKHVTTNKVSLKEAANEKDDKKHLHVSNLPQDVDK